jgi:hypothetical protein
MALLSHGAVWYVGLTVKSKASLSRALHLILVRSGAVGDGQKPLLANPLGGNSSRDVYGAINTSPISQP